VGSNFPVHEKTTREETTFKSDDANNGANARHVRWDQLMRENKGKIDVALAKKMEADHYDVVRKRWVGSGKTLCGHVDMDEQGAGGDWRAFYPGGASNAKATDSHLSEQMKMWAIAGHACGSEFKLDAFLCSHPEYEWQRTISGDMPSGPWALFLITNLATRREEAEGRREDAETTRRGEARRRGTGTRRKGRRSSLSPHRAFDHSALLFSPRPRFPSPCLSSPRRLACPILSAVSLVAC